ncbi:unnamed protein product [Scytosiphon promiscuus]
MPFLASASQVQQLSKPAQTFLLYVPLVGEIEVTHRDPAMKLLFPLHGGARLPSALPSAATLISIVSIMYGGTTTVAGDFDGYYARNVSLDANLDVFWTIDTESETIRVAVHAKSASGWVGVGISEMGGMEGADILYYETLTGNITDAHALVAGTPVVDECAQDWTLLSAEVGDGSLVFEAERALDTGDAQDRAFVDDTQDGVLPTRILAAWGDTDYVTYHDTNFAKGEAVIFGDAEDSATSVPLEEIKSSEDTTYFDVTARAQENFTIPTERTWYEETCLPASELPSLEEFHAIGFEGLLQSDTAAYVHHLVLRGWYGPDDCGQACISWIQENSSEDESGGETSGSTTGSTPSPSSFSSPSSYSPEESTTIPSFCDDFNFADIFAWAPGAAGMELPDDVGFLLGNSSGGFSSLWLQTHYDNPNGDTGMVDSSGVRVYYTEELRSMNMGVMELGDPFVNLDGLSLPDGKSGFSFNCPSSCTEEHFEADEVKLFYHFLHMHENGQTMRTRQYRNDSNGNEVLVHTAEVEYYSFLQAGGFSVAVNESGAIQRGDRFETECFYDTALSSIGSGNVTFGLGSEQEMCIDFVYYYPDQMLPASGSCGYDSCGGGVLATSALSADSDFNRTFGVVDTCTASANEEEGGEHENDSSSSPHGGLPALGMLIISTTVVLALMDAA